ncbi:MAG: BtrH N-terminal domain-containing protein, partial [Deltaproteobacteria bacterium]|nr:BtrH N-terminal domain-containing protein [Deltaproteobacteria bacterium]
MSAVDFKHRMAAHCESGTVTALLNHAGVEISEAMVFGVSGAIFFGYFRPKALNFPTFVLRNRPGSIVAKVSKHLGIRFRKKTFRDPDAAMAELDR